MSNQISFQEIQGVQNLLGTTNVCCEQPVIKGTVFTGVNFLYVNTEKLTGLTRHSGADSWCAISDAVSTGKKLFGAYDTVMSGEVVASINMNHWVNVFGQIAYKQNAVTQPKLIKQFQIGSMSYAAFAKALKDKWPNLKTLIADNILDYLPSWMRLGKKADQAESDLAPLHKELVANGIAMLAILDKTNSDHVKLKKQIGTNESGYNLISVTDIGHGDLRFRVKSPLSKYTVNLELREGKWCVKPAAQVEEAAAPSASATVTAPATSPATENAEAVKTEKAAA